MTSGTRRRWLTRLAVIVVVLGITNFFASFVVAAALGDPLGGQAVDGHYYLARRGSYTEVSESVWSAIRAYELLMLLTWPLVMLAVAYLLFRFAFPLLMSGKAPGHASERVALVRASGAALWQGSPGGVVGDMRATAGMLAAAVYPGGIVVMPRFMPASAIRADEIRVVRFGRRHLVTPTIEIEHAGIDIASPLVLCGTADSAQARAVLALSPGEGDDVPRPA